MSQNLSETEKSFPCSNRIVRPLFCFEVSYQTYFKFFTTLMILTSLLDLIMMMVYSTGNKGPVSTLEIIINLPILVVSAVIYSKFEDSGEYGTSLNYGFAMSILILLYLTLLSAVLVPIISIVSDFLPYSPKLCFHTQKTFCT